MGWVIKHDNQEMGLYGVIYIYSYVLKRSEANRVMDKTFRKFKSAGYKKIHQRTMDGYAWLSKRQVLKCVTTNEKLKKFNVKFTNKAKPWPVKVKLIHEQHQIDLVDMTNMQVEHQRKCYRYIPYSRKLTHNDFNAKEINTKKINANEDQ